MPETIAIDPPPLRRTQSIGNIPPPPRAHLYVTPPLGTGWAYCPCQFAEGTSQCFAIITVVDKEILIHERLAAAQAQAVFQIQMSRQHHIFIFISLSLLSSMLTWTWFLTAHILDYTTIDSCQVSVPLVWWLTFTILCTTYFLVLKVLVSMIYGILVFGFLGTVLHLPFSIGTLFYFACVGTLSKTLATCAKRCPKRSPSVSL
ncbi:hypothetical protein M405DRAFT_220415 [Rhizopogon salebrosus TDB-379]|nr:hypothetical protein M405DRAFT_220415 [Rhizopogon salebrosus TDB-379]